MTITFCYKNTPEDTDCERILNVYLNNVKVRKNAKSDIWWSTLIDWGEANQMWKLHQ